MADDIKIVAMIFEILGSCCFLNNFPSQKKSLSPPLKTICLNKDFMKSKNNYNILIQELQELKMENI